MIKLLLSLFILTLFLSCSKEGTLPGTNISFDENSSINSLNPDRGFYDATYSLSESTEINIFTSPKEKGYRLVYAVINLEDYLNISTLPDEFINTINDNFNNAKDEGVKLILRLKYRDGSGVDPLKEIIAGHLGQLKTTLQNHKSIISVIQAGLIGAYGEWHSFTGDYSESNADYISNRKVIVDTLNEIFPNKFIQIRTPVAKEMLYGSYKESGDTTDDAKITSEIAYSDDIRSKIAHHNDCFLADETDMGTYPSSDIEFYKDYVANDTKYSPVGGETCKDTQEFTTCSNALVELKKFQYSFLNEAYHLDVIQRFKDEGCYTQIKENLGYRFVAQKLNLQRERSNLEILLSITNQGYASSYIKYDVDFILKNEENSYTFVKNDIDFREYYPKETLEIQSDISLSDVESGVYCLYMKISDEYSDVILSNSDLWDEEMKANKLACSIVVE